MNTNKNTAAVIGGMANRYELRSKRKEGLEPKLKLKDEEIEVKEVNGSKGRKKRAVLSTSTAAAASDDVHITDGSGDPASAGMTFSIDHIREQIFRSLLSPDLKNCRLVCRSWNSFASLELQKRIKYSCFVYGTTEFSKNLDLFNKRPKSMLGLPLPYSSFWFGKQHYSADFLKNKAMLKFLNNNGPDIQELSFEVIWGDKSQPSEKEVIDFVTNLLLHQTPNLSKLEIMLRYSASWEEGGSTRKWDSTLLTTDPEFKEVHSKTWETNSKLKVLTLTGVSAKLLEVVTQLAPNLKEINPQDYFFHVNDCKYFMEPLNRLGLLKKIHLDPYSVENLEAFENVCELIESGDTSLKLREIYFGFSHNCNDDEDIRARGRRVINRLLECSWDSLETIKWEPSAGLSGLKWPEVLSNVVKLTIITCRLSKHGYSNGFSWSTTFPKLRSLSLSDAVGETNFTVLMDVLFENQKIKSVKEVHVGERRGCVKKNRLTPAQRRRFQFIFPNAKIRTSVPLSDSSYGSKVKFPKSWKLYLKQMFGS